MEAATEARFLALATEYRILPKAPKWGLVLMPDPTL